MNLTLNLRWTIAALAMASLAPPAHAQSASTTIQANAKVVKSLQLTAKQNLDFGTITLSGTPGTYTVAISQSGAVTCPSGATCAGTVRQGIMNVQGSNAQIVRITIPIINLVNTATGATIPFVPDAPATITLTNSGSPGRDFNIGGSIAVPSTADGTYSGNISVTVDYQ
ncbi:DUF4402 domain-containing protein [Sphingomonas sp. NSE70-1]|uniref:DUF4402 domain-containing protein n=1 Tax=Sphingomonas caseinilyticus TaxID=2908205 RepID=A0ABT0RSM7_9SPHN|nr:DUF4402 domain-containing protein [Sphingomonas caseinilyticus]